MLEGNEMFKNLSLTTKIIACVSAVAAVGGVVLLVILLMTGGGGNGGGRENADTPVDGDSIADIDPADTIGVEETPEVTPEPTDPEDPIAPVVPTDGPVATSTPDLSSQTTPSPTPSPTPTPKPTATPTQAPAPTTWSYAYIVNHADTSTAYKTFAFIYMDWLTGAAAVTKYMQDYGCSKEEAESETEEFGYIRNAGLPIKWFNTTSNTKYYLPDSSMSKAVEADRNAFNTKMIPAIENDDSLMTFVIVTVSGDDIVKIEWVYHP